MASAFQIGAKSSETCACTAGMTAWTLASDSTEHWLTIRISVAIDLSCGESGNDAGRLTSFRRHRRRPALPRWPSQLVPAGRSIDVNLVQGIVREVCDIGHIWEKR